MRPSFDASMRGGNICLNKVTLAGLSGAATTFSTTGTTTFAIGGAAYTKTAISSGATPTTDANTGAAFTPLQTGKKCMFVFGLDASGNTKVAQGPIVNTSDVSNGAAAVQFPEIPDTMCPIGYVEVSHANATAWTFGTSNWNATGVTIGTPVDVILLPTSPLTA